MSNIQEKMIKAIEDVKGQDIKILDVKGISDVMDTLVIVTGTSNRHVKSVADTVMEELKQDNIRPIGTEGKDVGEWVLVDYGDTVLHVMLAATRELYALEKLWSMEPESRKNS